MVGWPTVRPGPRYTALFPTPTSRFTNRQYVLGTITFCILAIFSLSGHTYYRKHSDRPQREHPYANGGPDDDLRQCSEVIPEGTSRVLGGIPGFYTLENVWYNNSTFHLYGEDFPEAQKILSDKALVFHDSLAPRHRPAVCFDGTSILNNEGAGGNWNGLWHYYHFTAEDSLGALAGHAAVEPEVPGPSRLIIPWNMNWRDKWGLNEMITEGIFEKPVVEQVQWDRITGRENWVYFERVVIIDRWSSHRNNAKADLWNKMSVPIFETPHRANFFKPYRQRLLDHYDISSKPAACPKIVYIDRQSSSRRLSDATENDLLDLLRGVEKSGQGRFHHVILEDLTVVQQIEVVADATVMIGIHGNGLTHEMWMSEDSTLIEMFPPDTFLRDYQSVAQVLDHQYYAVVNDTILLKSDWEEHPGERKSGRTHDGTEVELSIPLVKQILEDVLRGKSAACRS